MRDTVRGADAKLNALRRFPIKLIEEQCISILQAWGFARGAVLAATKLLTYADLRGIDSHGITMLAHYAARVAKEHFNRSPEITTVIDVPSVAVLDAGGGFGHEVSIRAMSLCMEKAQRSALASVAVRNSDHFGAAAYYVEMAAAKGLIGIATTSVWNTMIVPTYAAEPIFGTNPIAFAAPARRNPPFVLDMATSTVARGKIQLAALSGKSIPPGWAVDEAGAPITDALAAWNRRWLTPLGGTADMSSHKGYGLAAMVEVLSAALAGAKMAALHSDTRDGPGSKNVGHFFLVMDPSVFRPDGGFLDDMDALIDRLRATKPATPEQPVLVPGDPERMTAAERTRLGVPISSGVCARLEQIASECKVPFLLR